MYIFLNSDKRSARSKSASKDKQLKSNESSDVENTKGEVKQNTETKQNTRNNSSTKER